MAKGKRMSSSSEPVKRSRPALTPESRESQMIALAMNAAEQQLRDGTASSQVITHFLKLATEEKRLEREKLARENELLRAKTEAIESAKNIEHLYKDAIDAMMLYRGQGSSRGDEDE